ncbi:MAG: trigger factor [Thermodesulfobacteriota bacterium]|nr:MAG: trigger factor [Thermodesulfobacteriota bacterium]
MKEEVKDISPVVKQLEVTISADSIGNEIEKFYFDLRKTAKIKGFRPGKVPRAVLERIYKKQVEGEVISKLVSDSYETAIKETNILPVSPPIIDTPKFAPEKDFTYTARVEVAPALDLKGDYLGIEAEQEKLEVTEEDVNQYLEQIRAYHAQLKTVEEDRSIRSGDFVVIDYAGTIEKEPLKGGKVLDRLIEITPESFLPGFTNQLIGLRSGANREIVVTTPEDFGQKEFAGKTITFDVTIKEIKEKITPPLDDNFARDVGEFETLAVLKDHLKTEITRREEERIRSTMYNNLLQKILENNPFDVPPSLVERQTEFLIYHARSQMTNQGIKMDSSPMMNRELKEAYRPIAEFQVKRSFLLSDIAKREGIEVDPSEIKAYLKNMSPDAEEDSEQHSGQEAKDRIKSKVLEEKTLAFLAEKAKLISVDRKKS